MTAHCTPDPQDDFFSEAAIKVWWFLQDNPRLSTSLTIRGIADCLRDSFPPSDSPRSDGRPLPVAALPHPPHREGVIQAVEAEI